MESQGIPVTPSMIFDEEVKKRYYEHKETEALFKKLRKK